MDKTRLWDIITGRQQLSWQQEWEQEDISLKDFLINWIIQRPYDN